MNGSDDTEEMTAEDVDFDIREAYPLMDEVARQQGWDDPEMDSYNIYSPARDEV